MSKHPSEWTTEEAYEHYRKLPEDEIRAAVYHSSKTGSLKLGAVKALQEIDDRKAAREEDRHGETMLASSHANRRANQALSVGVGALILALVAILQQCQG
jgi:hypothetical protein